MNEPPKTNRKKGWNHPNIPFDSWMDNEPSYRNCPSPGLTFFKPCWAWVRFLERVSCEQCLAGVSLHYNNSSQFPYTAIKSVITSISWSETSLSQLKHMDTVRVKIGYPNNWMLDTKNWLCLSSPRSWILTHTHIWNCIPSSEHLTEAFPCHWTSVAMFLQPPVVGQGEQSSIFLKEICWVKKKLSSSLFLNSLWGSIPMTFHKIRDERP